MVTTSTKNKLTQTLATGAAALGVALVAGVGSANAANIVTTETQMFMNTGTFVTLGGPFTPTTLNLTLPQFNPGVGETLQMVTIDFQQDWSGNGSAQNRASAPATLTLSLGADIGIVGPGFSAPSTVADLGAQTQTSPGFSASAYTNIPAPPYVAPDGFSHAFTPFSQSGQVAMLSSGLAPYIGAGTVSFTLDGRGNSNASGSPDIQSVFSTNASGKVSVTYKYEKVVAMPMPTDVPEPSAVLGLGLLSLGAFFKRNKQQDSDKG
jgi:hypothetical protein